MNHSKTNEQALEATIEKALTGTCREELDVAGSTQLAESLPAYQSGNGYLRGNSSDFNARYALDETRFWNFLESTHHDELVKLQRSSDWKLKVLERFDKMVKKHGVLHLLRKGLEVDDAVFTLFFEAPLPCSNQAVIDKFNSNQFSVTRQVRYNPDKTGEEIDMVLFCNGIPLVTMELKNAWTGQTAAVHGIRQYQCDRDPEQPLLTFGRCLVHFAVDTDEVYMCTRLEGKSSCFLPFNKGFNCGKGNPPNPAGHKTSYLWEDIFTRNSLAGIIQHFVLLSGKAKDSLATKTLYFPRYHQLDVVRQIVNHAGTNGVGHSYLIQHSAGSGKSNSITWCAYQLIETYPVSKQGAHSGELLHPLFDSVVVVTDRRLLDKQLGDNIAAFSEVKSIIARAASSQDLKKALEQGKRIIITTIQKFPFIVDGIADLSHKRFAVIIDEAHSSQGGTGADTMNQAMGISDRDDDEEEDIQDIILRAMQARKMKGNASYFAFTATPKNSTLEKFGTKQNDGSFKPFHLYSMKQAIEEGFILDVLANYTTYKSFYEIEKSIEDNPLFDTIKAHKKLKAYVEQDKRTIATKAEVMVDHFVNKVFTAKKLKGKAKAMVVTQSIASAIRYYHAIQKIVTEKGNPFKVAIAFSGTKEIDGIEYTEAQINGFSESETREKFDTDEYRILVVANKYLTGFDQPKLCTMYVDKKLQGVLAVQALSRLNRSANSLGKKTEDLFILDFFNDVADIKSAFDPFYTSTSLSGATNVNVLHDLKATLDETEVYEWAEVDQFNSKFFTDADAQELSPIIDVAAARFNNELGLDDNTKADFKIKAKQFVKIYGQMASILPFEIIAWEKLFWFLKFLIPKLIVKSKGDILIDELLESVDLSTYGLKRTKLNHSIVLDEKETEVKPANPNPRGAHGETKKDTLDIIVDTFNERWFQGWDETPEDQRVRFLSLRKHILAHPDYASKVANNADYQNKNIAFRKIIDDVMKQQRKKELELYKLYAQDEAFTTAFLNAMYDLTEDKELKTY